MISILALACNRGTATTTAAPPAEPTEVTPPIAPPIEPPIEPPPHVPPPADTRPCAGATLEEPVTVIVEGKSVRLSGQEVVADGIMMRWVKRKTGVTEHTTLARVSIVGGAVSTGVRVGTDLPIGDDRYCVVTIDYGREGPGSVSLQKLAP